MKVLTIHTRRVIIAMMMPGLCLALALVFNTEVYHLVIPMYTSLPYLPYLLLAAGLILAWGYNNGREFNLLMTLGIAYWAVREFVWSGTLTGQSQTLIFALLCVLIPLSYLMHSLLPDRGVWRWQMAKRASITLVQIGLVALLVKFQHPVILDALRTNFWQNPSPRLITLTQPGMIGFALASIALGVHLYLQSNVLRGGSIMSLLGIIMALNNIATPSMAMIYFSIAIGAILLSVVLNSYNLAYLDELTNLPSRRALKQQLMALGKRYSIAMLDIDHFKKFNDKYGHDIGDQALRKVAKHLRRISGGGKVYRYGGEEFTIVFSNKEAREALIYVDALRESIESDPFFIRGRKRPRNKPETPVTPEKVKKVRVTVSAGIAQRGEQHSDPFEVIKSADKALYRAKRAGRNRVHAI